MGNNNTNLCQYLGYKKLNNFLCICYLWRELFSNIRFIPFDFAVIQIHRYALYFFIDCIVWAMKFFCYFVNRPVVYLSLIDI
nr:MAG TPA: hypothetical protein [Caudoviricetes sp.]